jgi:histidine ammonia-lyase
MIPQYLAASLVNAIVARSMPATAFSVPTCANTEDHVSMGPTEGYDVLAMLEHLRTIQAVELLIGGQAAELRQQSMQRETGQEMRLGEATARILSELRRGVPLVTKDRELQPLLDSAQRLLVSEKFDGLLNPTGS